MKLDKIKFAKLIAMLASEYGYIHEGFIQAVDNLIDVDMPEQAQEPMDDEPFDVMSTIDPDYSDTFK